MLGCWESVWKLGYLCTSGIKEMCLWYLAMGYTEDTRVCKDIVL